MEENSFISFQDGGHWTTADSPETRVYEVSPNGSRSTEVSDYIPSNNETTTIQYENNNNPVKCQQLNK